MKKKKDEYAILSILKGLELLEVFCKTDHVELGVSELSKKIGLSKNQVFRILMTLSSKGYVEQNRASQNYRLGVKVVELCRAYTRKATITRLPRNVLEEFQAKIGETVLLCVPNGSKAVCVDTVESSHPVRVATQSGSPLPLHATAHGKAQIAFLGGDDPEGRLPKELTRFTSKTMTDRKKVLEQLQDVVRTGWAFEDEEYLDGVRAIAVPVYDYAQQVVGSIGVSAPSYRLSDETIRTSILPELQLVASNLSRRLGYIENMNVHGRSGRGDQLS